MAEPFQGRYQLGEPLLDCGELPRRLITGATLVEPCEAITLGGARRWSGLVETIWLRVCRRLEHPGVGACAPVAVEQEGDSLLVIHPELPQLSWEDAWRQLPPDRFRAEIVLLLNWFRDTLGARVGWGNLRLCTIRRGENAELVVSPAAYTVPLPLLSQRGRSGRRWRALFARGEEGEKARDIALLGRDLARLLAPQLARDDSWPPALRAEVTQLRDGLASWSAAALTGLEQSDLERRLDELRSSGSAAAAVERETAAERDCDPLSAAVAELARRPEDAGLLLPALGNLAVRVRAAAAAALPVHAELAVARGLVLEPVAPPAGRAAREEGEAWLLIVDGAGQPPAAAARWLARTRGRRRKLLICLPGETAREPAYQLLLRDLESRWDLAVSAVAPEDPLAAPPPVAPLPPLPEDAQPAAFTLPDGQEGRVVLCLAEVAGTDLPLPLLAQAAALPARRLGEVLAPLLDAGWLRWSAVQAGWTRADWVAATVQTPAGRAVASSWMADESRQKAFRELLLSSLGAGRRTELRWLRFHLAARTREGSAAERELDAILAEAAAPEDDYLVVAACAEALAAPLADVLTAALRLRAGQRLGRTLQERGLLDDAQRVFESVLQLAPLAVAQSPDPEAAAAVASLAVSLADLLDQRGEFAAEFTLLQQIAATWEALLPPAARARLQFETAWARYRLGQHDEALEICHALLRLLDVDDSPAEAADVYNLIGLVRYESSRYEEARINIQKALVLRERVGDQAAISRSCNNLGLVHIALGDFARAEANLQRSLAIKNSAGDLPGTAGCLLNMAYIALHQEQFDLARERGEHALAISQTYALQQLTAEILLVLGEVAEAQGRLGDCAASYAQAQALAERIGDDDHRLAVLRHQIGLALREADSDRAHACLGEAEALAARVPSQLQRALLRELAGDLLAATGDSAPAAEAYEECAVALVALHKPELLARVQARAALARARSGQAARARELFAELRLRIMDLRLGKLPPEFHELEKLLGADRQAFPTTTGVTQALLRSLFTLPSLEAQRLEFPVYARRVVDLLSASEAFATVSFTLLAPMGEELGRWETPAAAGPGGPTIAARDLWPDGTEILGAASLLKVPDGDAGQAIVAAARDALALAVAVLAGYRARVSASDGGPAASPEVRMESPRARAATLGPALIGVSEPLADLRRFIDRVAPLDAHVLILGENGTGKELVARQIHQRGPRRNEPFVAVNCASIPATLLESALFGHEKGAFTDAVARHLGEFERAAGGTILLDEIGEMPPPLQVKLLRVLQEKEFHRVGGGETIRLHARVLAATNVDLERAVAEGSFRQDLYYRLAVVPVRVPPLRERRADIPLLLRHFLEVYAAELGQPVCDVEPEAIEALTAAPWPGNVRELQNLARRLLIFWNGLAVRRADLPASVLGAESVAEPVECLEELVARLVRVQDCDPHHPLLPRLQGLLARHMTAKCENKAQAARLLGISAPTLYEWLRRDRQTAGNQPPLRRPGARS